VALEDDAAVQARTGHLAAVHDHLAAARGIEARQDVEDGRLAATGVADHADELAALQGEGDVVEDGRGAGREALGEAPDLQEGGAHSA